MTFKTSDNSTYTLNSEHQLESLKAACAENGIRLFDESGNEIELIKEKKTKK